METACRFAHGVVTELLSQGQMAGLCTETYSPPGSRLTSTFAKVDILNGIAKVTQQEIVFHYLSNMTRPPRT